MPSVIASLIAVAEASLLLLKSREENYDSKKIYEYSKKINDLKKEWYDEYNKDQSIRSDAYLDFIRLELCNFVKDYSAFIRAAGIQDKQ